MAWHGMACPYMWKLQCKHFLSQPWDLLRVIYSGFIGLCTSFLAEDPNFNIPVGVNGSALESYFSQLKFSAGGQLSSYNYAIAQASVETTKAAAIKRPRETNYCDAGLDIHPVQLKKQKYIKEMTYSVSHYAMNNHYCRSDILSCSSYI